MIKIKVELAKTIWQQTKGLIGTNQPHPLLIKTRWGIHTFGMKYPIDVVILDSSNKIESIKENLPPNRIFLWKPKYETVLELPEGTIRIHRLKIGQTIQLVMR